MYTELNCPHVGMRYSLPSRDLIADSIESVSWRVDQVIGAFEQTSVITGSDGKAHGFFSAFCLISRRL